MPQMSPLNWTFLFSVFLILLIIMNIKMSFLPMNKITTKKNKMTMMNKNMTWKW